MENTHQWHAITQLTHHQWRNNNFFLFSHNFCYSSVWTLVKFHRLLNHVNKFGKIQSFYFDVVFLCVKRTLLYFPFISWYSLSYKNRINHNNKMPTDVLDWIWIPHFKVFHTSDAPAYMGCGIVFDRFRGRRHRRQTLCSCDIVYVNVLFCSISSSRLIFSTSWSLFDIDVWA